MAGTLVAATYDSGAAGTAPLFKANGTEIGTLCRAWVNFNGTTSPGTINASFNVGSVTKNGTGDYTVNFTNSLADGNYSYQCLGVWIYNDPNAYVSTVGPKPNNGGTNPCQAGSIRVVCVEATAGVNNYRDYVSVSVAVFR